MQSNDLLGTFKFHWFEVLKSEVESIVYSLKLKGIAG